MPRRKKGRDKPKGKKRNRKKKQGFELNTRPYYGPKHTYTPVERKPWEQRRPVQTGRAIEDIIGLSVLDGKDNPVSKLVGDPKKEHPKGDEKK